jgi:hypothetical protein
MAVRTETVIGTNYPFSGRDGLTHGNGACPTPPANDGWVQKSPVVANRALRLHQRIDQ